ncbi:MAG: PKD domain-containing protein [Bacteroidetes bacterium]|nr:PKD domain-containing protein [Bacteroidota bacterium]MBT5529634.1 PKD domain-containing protein [Cytophagia bacterium]MBT3424870.1 PKD domain-containing protein [Bacteroidota bacterium]MBT3800532.1 PKD domain-containing protein [Bacteroidota bacterium]MBT3933832.1 PKD domain-containing protein [Bacteroidota bacterium]
MRKLILALFFVGFFALGASSQTVAEFKFNTACFGDSTTLTSLATSTNTILQLNWDIDSNGLFTDDTGAVVKWLFPAYQSYTVGLQVITNVDTVVIYKTVLTRAQPTANFNIDFPKQCLSSNFFTYTNASSLASGSMTYFWDLGNGVTSNTATDTNCIYFSAGTFSVKLIATSDSGCMDSITQNAEVLTASVVDFIANDTSQCLLGNSFLFTDNSLMCDPVLNFSWDLDGDGVFGDSVNQSPLTHIFTTPGNYQIGFKVTTTLGGVDSIYKTMYVYATPASSFAFTTDSGQCLAANSFAFNNTTVLGGPGSVSYLWNYGDGDTSTATNPPVHTYLTQAAFPVKLLATSDMGCIDSTIMNANIYPQPVVDFIFADSLACTADTFKMTNNSTIPSPWVLTYNWDFGDASTDTAQNPSHNYIASGNYTVKLIAVSDSGCSDSITKMAYVYATSVARFNTNDTDQCLSGNAFTFINNSISCSPVVSIEWDFDGDNIADALGDTVNYSFVTSGIFAIGMRLTTTTDTDSISMNMMVYPDPVAGFTVNDSTQALGGNSFIFTNTSSITPPSALTYLWNFADGDTSSTASPTHSYLAIGTYPVKLNVVSVDGCSDSITSNMYVNSPLNLGFISFEVCDGDSMIFVDTTISGSPILSIDWDMNNDNVFTNATGPIVKYLFPSFGIYNVGMMITTASSVDTIYKSVTVNEIPIVDFSFTEACQGVATSLLDQSTIVKDTIVKYYWDFDNDGNPDDSNTNAITNFAVAGTILVGHAVVTNKGCFDFVVKPVKVNFQPSADFSFSDNCIGDSTLFTNNTVILNDTVINYLWDYGDGTDAIIKDNHRHYYALDGTYAVRLITLSNKACRDTVTKSVTIHPSPALNLLFSGDTTFYSGSSVTITAGPGPYDSIFWSTGQTSAAIIANSAGVHTVRVVDTNNCSAEDSTLISLINVTEFKANEVLTPNGDNINDLWIIYDLPFYAPVEVNIYNRWGDVMYSSTNYQNDWDATFNGQKLPEGTYYYIIRTKIDDVQKGSLNIIR